MSVAFVYQGVTFYESGSGDSPSESTANDASRVERTYRVAWADRKAAERALLGTVAHRTDPVGNPYLSRTLPHADLERPHLRAKSVPRITGISPRRQTPTDRGGAMGYDKAQLTVQYELLDYDVVDDGLTVGAFGLPDESLLRRFVVREADITSQTFLMRGGAFKWEHATAGLRTPVLEGTPLQLRSAELTYTWVAVPDTAVPWVAASALLDRKTNNALFDGRWAAETLTLTMWKPQKRYAMPDGTVARNIVAKMKYRPQGVNYFPRPPTAGITELMQPVSSNGNPADAARIRPYKPADFSALFRPGT